MSKNIKNIEKSRNWATIIYDESAPDNWQEILDGFHVPGYRIKHAEDGKKPHWHVMLTFDGVKSAEQMKELFGQIGGVGAENIKSKGGYLLYLTHANTAGKHHYSVNDVVAFGGAIPYTDAIKGITTNSKYENISEMIAWINKSDCLSFADLVEYARLENKEWFMQLCDSNTYLLFQYIRARRYERSYE